MKQELGQGEWGTNVEGGRREEMGTGPSFMVMFHVKVRYSVIAFW